MAPAFRLRITTFAVLIVISFAVNAPSVSNAVEVGTLGKASNDVLGICTPDQVASPAPGDNATPQYAFRDDSVFMNAFGTQGEYSAHVMGIDYANTTIGFATTGDGDLQRTQGNPAHGTINAGHMANAAFTQQLASLNGSSAIANITQQPHNLNPVPGSSQGGRFGNIAGSANPDVVANASPADAGSTTDPIRQGTDTRPTTGSQDGNPVVVVAKAETDGEVANARPAENGNTNPVNQGKTSPVTGGQEANPVITIAKAPEGDVLNPFIYGSPESPLTDLIEIRDGVGKPIVGGDTPSSNPPVGCQSNGTCQAPQTVATNAVPEPGSMALLGLGMIGVVLSRRRKSAMVRQ